MPVSMDFKVYHKDTFLKENIITQSTQVKTTICSYRVVKKIVLMEKNC